MQLKKFYGKGCRVYVAHVLEAIEYDTPRLEGFHMIQEFMNVFPDEIPRLPPKSDVNFTFELMPGAAPMSHTPCRMNILEMLELNMQLQELLEKRYVKQSVCNTSVLTPFGLNVYDVYIIINRGVELKKNSPPSIYRFMFRQLKSLPKEYFVLVGTL